jgi:hypothetical protein
MFGSATAEFIDAPIDGFPACVDCLLGHRDRHVVLHLEE